MTHTIVYNRYKSRRIRAFSLAELMTAVGILGIGMMMIAMAFPVALDQTRQAVELSTGQLVCNEAVNTLKTRVKWTELSQYITVTANSTNFYDIGHDIDGITTTTRRCVDFTLTTGGGNPYFANFTAANQVYSADDTYGWMAAVEKINNQTYKFWIYVLREPTGVLDEIGGVNYFKFNFQLYNRLLNGFDVAAGNILRFGSEDDGVVVPPTGMYLVANTGQLIRVMDSSVEKTQYQYSKCDKDLASVAMIAYPINLTTAHVATHVTRKNPVISVYQVVISY